MSGIPAVTGENRMSDPSQPAPKGAAQYSNWVSLSGGVVAVGSIFSFLFLFAIDLFSHQGNPYMGILAYVVAPGFFFLGLAMLALGAWIHRRRMRSGLPPRTYTIDLSRPRDKKALIGFIAGAVVFLLASAMGSYNTYHYTESVNFCGTACHVPMKPEYTAYLNSSHARVACTECHVGPGAESYVKSKINGVHQLLCVATDSYNRPIKAPIKNMRPAQETCEQCHWPQKFVGSLDRTYSHFLADATNTPFTVRLLLKVGGADPSHGPTGGIHWHMSVDNKIEYITTDEQRQVIPWVRSTAKDGTVTVFKVKAFTDNPAAQTVRRMDCMDCHNRPAHDFSTPNDAVDLAMTLGQIDPAMPWVKSNAVASLIQNYSTTDEAMTKIAGTLRTAYNKSPKVDGLVAQVQKIYQQNFFPEMKSDWRSYPNNIGHKNWQGCFRCHDGLHKSEDGKRKIEATSCNACHVILAQGSGAQLDKLDAKGLDFFHIDAPYSDFSCNNCHTGAFVK
jgi:nitrate/TMAO reductase-like tetraheme cytochrome c subunit